MSEERAPYVIDHKTGEMVSSDETFELLDIHDRSATERPDWIATLSLGERNDAGLPTVARDGRFRLHDPHGKATALRALLSAADFRELTIAFTTDNLPDILHQRYVRYSQTAVEAFGDQYGITILQKGHEALRYLQGQPGYEEARKTCKVQARLFFVVSEWQGSEATALFPDEFGHYSFRTTSHNTLVGWVAKIREIQALTRGRIAGIPLLLRVEMREVAGPDGTRRTVPICTLALKPPDTIKLTTRTWSRIISQALSQGTALRMLNPPREETIEDMQQEIEYETLAEQGPSPEALAQVQTSDTFCDPATYERAWFMVVKGSPLESDEARTGYLRHYTHDLTPSLAGYLAQATESEASALIAQVSREVAEFRAAESEKSAKATWDLKAQQMEAMKGPPLTPLATTENAPVAAVGPSEALLEQPAVVLRAGYTREELIKAYAWRARKAEQLGIDLAPYELRGDADADQIILCGKQLREAIEAIEARQAIVAGGRLS